jgi:hypothetical protein
LRYVRCCDHAEEHPQVVASGEHRVRPTPTPEELQILIDQRHPQPHLLPGWSSGTNQTRVVQGHLEVSSSVDGQPQRLVEMSAKITGITSMSGRIPGPEHVGAD